MEPLDLLNALRLSGHDSVVAENSTSELQRALYIADPLESWLAAEIRNKLDSPEPRSALYLLTGNAGDGKSMLIERVREQVESHDRLTILGDATHADSPSEGQSSRIAHALASFSDTPSERGDVVLAAMNVGMAIRFFDYTDEGSNFRLLRQAILGQLGIASLPESEDQQWDCVVLDLGRRSLTSKRGAGSSFLEDMFEKLSPRGDGVMAEACQRCDSCPIKSACYVRSNLEMLRLGDATSAFQDCLTEATLLRNMHPTPRMAWDLLSRTLGSTDWPILEGVFTCNALRDAHSKLTDSEIAEQSFRRLLFNRLFDAARETVGAQEEALMSALPVSDPTHRTGLGSYQDEMRLFASRQAYCARLTIAARKVSREANVLDVLAARGERTPESDEDPGLRSIVVSSMPRLTRFLGIPEDVAHELRSVDLAEFRELLTSHRDGEWGESLDGFWEEVLAPGLQLMFGTEVGGENYLRRGSVSAQSKMISFAPGEALDHVKLAPTPPAPREAADLLGATSQTLDLLVDEVRVSVDLALWRLLYRTIRGGIPSARDREEYFRLTYAFERVGGGSTDKMIFKDTKTGRIYRLSRRNRPSGPFTILQEV